MGFRGLNMLSAKSSPDIITSTEMNPREQIIIQSLKVWIPQPWEVEQILVNKNVTKKYIV